MDIEEGGDTPETEDRAFRLLSDFSGTPEGWCQVFLRIRTKKATAISLSWNHAQQRLNNVVADLQASGKPIRVTVLKARQEGVSTWAAARAFERSCRGSNYNALVVAHKGESSAELFDMARFFLNSLPFKPKTDFSNRREIVFSDPINSKIRIESAENRDAARGQTNQFVHCSEVAFWRNPEETMLGVLQTVPDTPEAWVVFESTANGVGGYFYDAYWQAKNGESEFIAVFLPWWSHPEYDFDCSQEDYDRILATITPEEQEGIAKFHWEPGQLAWRRWAIANKCNGDLHRFKQEYPATEHEAFITSGAPAFDVDNLRALSEAKPREVLRGRLVANV